MATKKVKKAKAKDVKTKKKSVSKTGVKKSTSVKAKSKKVALKAKTKKSKVVKATKTAKKPAKKVMSKVSSKTTKKNSGKSKIAKTKIKKAAVKKALKTVKSKSKISAKNTAPKTVKSKKAPKSGSAKKGVSKKAEAENPKADQISGKNFLFTGTLTTMKRSEAEQKVRDLGGQIVSGVNDKLDFLVVGEKAGSKLKSAQKIESVSIIDEGQFNSLVSGTPATPSALEKDVYSIEFHVYGYGKENCVAKMTDAQVKYWKKKFDDPNSNAHAELEDHLWNSEDDYDSRETHFGKWYSQDDIVHDERACYDSNSILNIVVYKNGNRFDDLEINVTDKSLKKDFYDEFVPDKKKEKGNAYIYTGSVDRGAYCEGTYDLEPGEVFDKKKLSITVGKVFNSQFVWDICYDGECLDNEGCLSSTGKGFDLDVFFY